MMRHYEIVFLIHPDQGGQVPTMIERYRSMLKKGGAAIHRVENWGRRPLAYPIDKLYKAYYVLMNIECSLKILDELKHTFQYNDAVIRSLVIRRNKAISNPSPMAAARDAEAKTTPKGNRTKKSSSATASAVKNETAAKSETKEDEEKS